MPLALDTETFPIVKGNLCPRLVCLSWHDGKGTGLLLAKDVSPYVCKLLGGSDIIIGHNISFDVAVLCAHDPSLIPLWFKAYDEGRVSDTQIREQLLDLTKGQLNFEDNETGKTKRKYYALADLSEKYFKRRLAKGGDTWRLRYGELVNIPLEKWPKAAKDYALTDAVMTFQVWEAQSGTINERSRTSTGGPSASSNVGVGHPY